MPGSAIQAPSVPSPTHQSGVLAPCPTENRSSILLDTPIGVDTARLTRETLRECMLPPDLLARQIPDERRDHSVIPFLGLSGVVTDPAESMMAYASYRFKQAGLSNTWQELQPVVADLLMSPALVRLAGLRQMTFGYTQRGAECSHSRLLHSVDVMVTACFYARHLLNTPEGQGVMNPGDVVKFGLAGFLHDVGHPPFCHTGEEKLRTLGVSLTRRLGMVGDFNHEDNTFRILLGHPVADILENHGFNAGEICGILDHTHSLHGIQDFADRTSYLLRDLAGIPGISNDLKDRVLEAMVKLCGSMRIDPVEVRLAFTPGDGPALIAAIQDARRVLFQEASVSPEALLANRIIDEALTDLFTREVNHVDPAVFVGMTDQEVIAMMSPRFKEQFLSVNGHSRYEAKPLDLAYEIVLGFRMSDLLPGTESQRFGDSSYRDFERIWKGRIASDVMSALKSSGLRAGLAPDLIESLRIIPALSEVSKKIDYHIVGEGSARSHATVIQPSDRFLAVYLPAGLFSQRAREALASAMEKTFRNQQLIHPNARPCTHLVLGPTELSAYDFPTAV